MGRNYRKELRERGIVIPGLGQGWGWKIWYAWEQLDSRQRRAFCERAGLMPIPPRQAADIPGRGGSQNASESAPE